MTDVVSVFASSSSADCCDESKLLAKSRVAKNSRLSVFISLGSTWSNFDTARQSAIGILKQVHYDSCDILRLQLPTLLRTRLVAAKFGVDRTGHDVTHFDAVMTHFLHQCFSETIQAKLGCVVSSHARMGVDTRERRNVEDVTTTALLH